MKMFHTNLVKVRNGPEEEVRGNNVGLLPPGVSVPLGDAARDVIVQLADPSAQVPDHVHRTWERV